jgi:hypothetical protein
VQLCLQHLVFIQQYLDFLQWQKWAKTPTGVEKMGRQGRQRKEENDTAGEHRVQRIRQYRKRCTGRYKMRERYTHTGK